MQPVSDFLPPFLRSLTLDFLLPATGMYQCHPNTLLSTDRTNHTSPTKRTLLASPFHPLASSICITARRNFLPETTITFVDKVSIPDHGIRSVPLPPIQFDFRKFRGPTFRGSFIRQTPRESRALWMGKLGGAQPSGWDRFAARWGETNSRRKRRRKVNKGERVGQRRRSDGMT